MSWLGNWKLSPASYWTCSPGWAFRKRRPTPARSTRTWPSASRSTSASIPIRLRACTRITIPSTPIMTMPSTRPRSRSTCRPPLAWKRSLKPRPQPFQRRRHLPVPQSTRVRRKRRPRASANPRTQPPRLNQLLLNRSRRNSPVPRLQPQPPSSPSKPRAPCHHNRRKQRRPAHPVCPDVRRPSVHRLPQVASRARVPALPCRSSRAYPPFRWFHAPRQ